MDGGVATDLVLIILQADQLTSIRSGKLGPLSWKARIERCPLLDWSAQDPRRNAKIV